MKHLCVAFSAVAYVASCTLSLTSVDAVLLRGNEGMYSKNKGGAWGVHVRGHEGRYNYLSLLLIERVTEHSSARTFTEYRAAHVHQTRFASFLITLEVGVGVTSRVDEG